LTDEERSAVLAGVVAVGRIDDGGLVERAARGQPEAFDQLIRPRLDRLYRMALTILRNESDARDAVQEACVLAWREVPRLRDRGRFDAWLSQILVNACRGQLRRGRRTRVREIDVAEAEDHVGFATGGHEAFGEVEAIRRAFDRLDPDTRSLLALHYVEERPLAEIGRMMGAPVGTIKWRLSNARKALDRALAEERR
jgi:RNA polymerase sigma-70 factor (ECF subfamily)